MCIPNVLHQSFKLLRLNRVSLTESKLSVPFGQRDIIHAVTPPS